MTRIRISDIVVGERTRRCEGSVDELASSIEDIGLLHPITVTTDYRLVAGHRRLRAVQQLGWEEVEANIVDCPVLKAELDENVQRLDFTNSEKIALLQKIRDSLLDSGSTYNEATEEAAEVVGLTPRTAARIKRVVDSGDEEVIEALDKGEVSPAKAEDLVANVKKVRRRRPAKEIGKPKRKKPGERDDPVKLPPITDGIGLEVPQELREIWDIVGVVEKTVRLIKNIYPLIHQIANHPGGKRYSKVCRAIVRDGEAKFHSNSLHNAIRELNQLSPYVSGCPKCLDKVQATCKVCFGNGWLDKEMWDSTDVTDEMRQNFIYQMTVEEE